MMILAVRVAVVLFAFLGMSFGPQNFERFLGDIVLFFRPLESFHQSVIDGANIVGGFGRVLQDFQEQFRDRFGILDDDGARTVEAGSVGGDVLNIICDGVNPAIKPGKKHQGKEGLKKSEARRSVSLYLLSILALTKVKSIGYSTSSMYSG